MLRTHPMRSAIVAAALAATFVVTREAAPAAPPTTPALASLPFTIAGWSGSAAPPLETDVAEGLAADQYVRRYYRDASRVVEMDIAYYGQPKVGANMHSPLNCLPGSGWEITHVADRALPTTIGPIVVRELTARLDRTQYALTYWYQSRHRIVASEYAARLHLFGDAIRRRPADAGLVRVMMPATGSGEQQRDTLAAFAARLIPEIDVRIR
jgi:EpsI family protein